MKWAKATLHLLWKLYLAFVVVLSLLMLFPFYLIVLNFDRFLEQGFHLSRFQARLILFMTGIRTEKRGSIPNDKEVSYLICPNHTSYMDILVLYAVFPNYFVFVGKKELSKVPLLSLFFKKLNILVDRYNPQSAHRSLIQVRERLSKGTNVVIFPEGTISKNAPDMRPFKNGAFRIALELNLPIIPVTFLDNYKILEDSMKFGANSRPGKTRVIIHSPIFTDEMKGDDLLILREQCKEEIASSFKDHKA